MSEVASSFGDLRKLTEWFATLSSSVGSPFRRALHVERLVQRLGTICVPLLGRELCNAEPRRREAARAALAALASSRASAPDEPATRARVIVELRAIAGGANADDGKVCALGLLAELGAHTAARFNDTDGIQRRSALALAGQLDDDGAVAAAADMMVRQLDDDALIHLLEVLADTAPRAAHQLVVELRARLDVDAELRDRIAEVPTDPRAPSVPARPPRPTHTTVLVDGLARLVVIASRKVIGERRWRRWAVLIAADGRIDDCIHEDDADTDAAPLIATLVADGYRIASDDLEHARTLVAGAAKASVAVLDSPYYVGRDLLELGDAHLAGRARSHPAASALGRAVDALADADPARAQALLARCDTTTADVAAAIAACLLAQGRPADAQPHLARAIDAEPDWPLHHWNLAAALHQQGDARGCYHALRRFVATSAAPSGLYGDPDQPARVGLAERLLSELERTARLTGQPLARPRRRKSSRTRRRAR